MIVRIRLQKMCQMNHRSSQQQGNGGHHMSAIAATIANVKLVAWSSTYRRDRVKSMNGQIHSFHAQCVRKILHSAD